MKTYSSKIFGAGLVTAALFVLGCETAPTIKDVDTETVASDTHIVFGTVDVFDQQGKRQKFGMGWTGANMFYLTILPASSSEATTYKVGKDGSFYWSLKPGDYTLLGWHWDYKGERRSSHLGIPFTVPESGGDTYLGSFVFRAFPGGLLPMIEDRFDSVVSLYDRKFPGRKGTAVRRVAEMPDDLGTVANYMGQCHEDWKITCTKRFRGVTPVSPDVTKSGFPEITTLRPTFSWKPCPRDDVSYDFVLYEAASYSVQQTINQYMRGHRIAYVEDLKEATWTPDVALRPGTRYFWSVRMRQGDTVSYWSTHSHFTFALIYASSGYGQWFQFKTPQRS